MVDSSTVEVSCIVMVESSDGGVELSWGELHCNGGVEWSRVKVSCVEVVESSDG